MKKIYFLFFFVYYCNFLVAFKINNTITMYFFLTSNCKPSQFDIFQWCFIFTLFCLLHFLLAGSEDKNWRVKIHFHSLNLKFENKFLDGKQNKVVWPNITPSFSPPQETSSPSVCWPAGKLTSRPVLSTSSYVW